ncbi:MAG: hypothetical protein ACI89D_000210 [Bermanella sp.]|jgi:hypothetical protein
MPHLLLSLLLLLVPMSYAEPESSSDAHPGPVLLWGDTHVHSAYSFDAFLNGNHSATPDTAYRFASGEPVIHPFTRARVQIDRPLDFIVVADHAEFYGVARKAFYGDLDSAADAGPIDRLALWFTKHFIRHLVNQGSASALFGMMLPKSADATEEALAQPNGAPIDTSLIERSVWQDATALADHYNQPGKFTTFVGWEWSSTPGAANLHRVVMSNANAQQAATFRPFSAVDSPFPEDLWRWLADTQKQSGIQFLSIPHNSNISKGYMFDERSLRGEAFTAEYLALRKAMEPVAEITQIKGDSETHEALSPNDEFAKFETYGWYMQRGYEPYKPMAGDYLRSALLRGLSIENQQGINPYQLGFIGSTDSHTALSSTQENDFHGKHANESTPETKSRPANSDPDASGWSMSASGRAAVWAASNNRDDIMAALRRREVYATTGTRIALQVFASWDFADLNLEQNDWPQQARARGVAMGGELPAQLHTPAPEFAVIALQDPDSARLDRVQIIKGWINQNGDTMERIYDIAWSGKRTINADHKVPAIADTVNRRTGAYDKTLGASQLAARWRDPDFNTHQAAFYYIRVLEVPTPKHLLLDALALGLNEPPEGASVIQERAYSSPIWYRPTVQ